MSLNSCCCCCRSAGGHSMRWDLWGPGARPAPQKGWPRGATAQGRTAPERRCICTLESAPSIMHPKARYKPPQIEASVGCDEEQSSRRRESKHQNSQDEIYSTLLRDVVVCFSSLFHLYVGASRGSAAEPQVIRHSNWLCLESNCCV